MLREHRYVSAPVLGVLLLLVYELFATWRAPRWVAWTLAACVALGVGLALRHLVHLWHQDRAGRPPGSAPGRGSGSLTRRPPRVRHG